MLTSCDRNGCSRIGKFMVQLCCACQCWREALVREHQVCLFLTKQHLQPPRLSRKQEGPGIPLLDAGIAQRMWMMQGGCRPSLLAASLDIKQMQLEAAAGARALG